MSAKKATVPSQRRNRRPRSPRRIAAGMGIEEKGNQMETPVFKINLYIDSKPREKKELCLVCLKACPPGSPTIFVGDEAEFLTFYHICEDCYQSRKSEIRVAVDTQISGQIQVLQRMHESLQQPIQVLFRSSTNAETRDAYLTTGETA